MYHVSSSPVNNTLLEMSASPSSSSVPTPTGFVHTAQPLSSQEADPSSFRIAAPFSEPPGQTPRPRHDRLDPRAELTSSRDTSSRLNRTADWVEMVERSGLMGPRGAGGDPGTRSSYNRNPYFRRTSSFNDTKPQILSSGQFRERSMTQVTHQLHKCVYIYIYPYIYTDLLMNYLIYRLDLEPFLMEVVGAKKDGRGSCVAPMLFQRMEYQSGLNSDLTMKTRVSLLTADSGTQEPTRAAWRPT